jgi:hypothetical protein
MKRTEKQEKQRRMGQGYQILGMRNATSSEKKNISIWNRVSSR